MIAAGIALASVAAIAVSEILGRGTVVYTRVLGLVASCALACAAAGAFVIWSGGGAAGAAAVALSVVPVMAAWLGFRIHLSNSITLELAELMADGRPRTLPQIEEAYDVDAHASRRVEILREGGYLSRHADASLLDTPRTRLVLLLIRVLCGPRGPRAVAEMTRRKAGDGDGRIPAALARR